MNRKQLGDKGVASAIAHYTLLGYNVSIPLSDTTKYDLIIDDGTSIRRVEVKTGQSFSPAGTPVVTLSTQGGNQSWNGKKNFISIDNTDEVFVLHLSTMQMWVFPVGVCAGKGSLTLTNKLDIYKIKLGA